MPPGKQGGAREKERAKASPREPPLGGRMGEEPPNGGGGGGQGDCATVQGVGEWFGNSPGSPPLGGGWGRERP